jgi:hypothetical protein
MRVSWITQDHDHAARLGKLIGRTRPAAPRCALVALLESKGILAPDEVDDAVACAAAHTCARFSRSAQEEEVKRVSPRSPRYRSPPRQSPTHQATW